MVRILAQRRDLAHYTPALARRREFSRECALRCSVYVRPTFEAVQETRSEAGAQLGSAWSGHFVRNSEHPDRVVSAMPLFPLGTFFQRCIVGAPERFHWRARTFRIALFVARVQHLRLARM